MQALEHLLADFCDAVVVVGAVGGVGLEEGELWFVEFTFDEYPFEVSAVVGHVLCRLFQHF